MGSYTEYEVNAEGTLSDYNGTTQMMCLDANILVALPVKDCDLPSGTRVKYNICEDINTNEGWAKNN